MSFYVKAYPFHYDSYADYARAVEGEMSVGPPRICVACDDPTKFTLGTLCYTEGNNEAPVYHYIYHAMGSNTSARVQFHTDHDEFMTLWEESMQNPTIQVARCDDMRRRRLGFVTLPDQVHHILVKNDVSIFSDDPDRRQRTDMLLSWEDGFRDHFLDSVGGSSSSSSTNSSPTPS